jgi:hypothetical protein
MPGDMDLLKDELLAAAGFEIRFAPGVVIPVPVAGDPREVLWSAVLGVGTVARLQVEYVLGRIGLGEFEERVAVAVAAEDAAL